MLATVTVKGSFREKGTNKPIAGLTVALNGTFGGDHFAVTGADGKYQGCITRENTPALRLAGQDSEPLLRPSRRKGHTPTNATSRNR